MSKLLFAGLGHTVMALIFCYLYYVSVSPDRIAYLFGAVMFVVHGAADRIIARIEKTAT